MGIPEKDRFLVFKKFYRVERSLKVGGIGLGLSISKGIVDYGLAGSDRIE